MLNGVGLAHLAATAEDPVSDTYPDLDAYLIVFLFLPVGRIPLLDRQLHSSIINQ